MDKIKFTTSEIPKEMWGVGSVEIWREKKRITYEITGHSDNMRESYLILFNTENEAKSYIEKRNKQDWFRNRNNQPIKINTTLKKWKSKYVPLQYAMNKLYQY